MVTVIKLFNIYLICLSTRSLIIHCASHFPPHHRILFLISGQDSSLINSRDSDSLSIETGEESNLTIHPK